MATIRNIAQIIEPQLVREGAGVRLKRSIAGWALDYLDPFLLFDHFGSDNPADYLAGFPMHPHRGIETVTYMLAGEVRHRDSLGNAGTIAAGDVQWMTSGRGILHEEMPKPVGGKMWGFQLWVNLPARLKMTRPRYQEFLAASIPEAHLGGGVRIRVVAGEAGGVRGPVTEIAADPTYLDVILPGGAGYTHPVPRGHTAFAYVFEGAGAFEEGGQDISGPKLIVLGDGDTVQVRAGREGLRFLLVSGKPLGEPIARYGPFVMNTREEIMQALEDLRNGTFVRAD
jgi:redox-sensitive bicupin YhaK (pirin superfamily)